MSFDAALPDAQALGNFVGRQSPEEAIDDNARSLRVKFLQLGNSLIQQEDHFGTVRRGKLIECDPAHPLKVPPMAEACPAAGLVDQDVPHGQ
jgi:hypothetical protein